MRENFLMLELEDNPSKEKMKACMDMIKLELGRLEEKKSCLRVKENDIIQREQLLEERENQFNQFINNRNYNIGQALHYHSQALTLINNQSILEIQELPHLLHSLSRQLETSASQLMNFAQLSLPDDSFTRNRMSPEMIEHMKKERAELRETCRKYMELEAALNNRAVPHPAKPDSWWLSMWHNFWQISPGIRCGKDGRRHPLLASPNPQINCVTSRGAS